MKTDSEISDEIMDDYQGKPYAILGAVLLGLALMVIAVTFLIMNIINLLT
jgi:hypothetical protein